MFKNKSIWVLSILASSMALSACQPKAEQAKDKEFDQSSTSEVQTQPLVLQGETEKVPVLLAACEGNSCPEISIDRLQTNQFVLDGLIDQAIVQHLKAMLENTDQADSEDKKQDQNVAVDQQSAVNTAASDVAVVKTPAQLLAEQVQPYVNSFLALDKELKSLGAGHQISLSVSPKILNSDGALATVVLNTSSYLGGAHGSSSQTYYNFDLKTQKKVELEQIIQSTQKEKLNTLAHEAFKTWVLDSKLADNVADYEQSWKFILSKNYYLAKQGLILQYAEYEIGPYVVGLPRLTIPYAQLNGILKPEYLPANAQIDQASSEAKVTSGLTKSKEKP